MNEYWINMKQASGAFDVVGEDGFYYADSAVEAIETAMIETGIQDGTFRISNTNGSGEGDGLQYDVVYIGDGDFVIMMTGT